MTYNFLFIDLFLLLIPIMLLLTTKVFLGAHLRAILLPSLLSSIIFSGIATLFAFFKIWTFNPNNLIGFYYKSLPLEHYIFVFAFSLAGLSIYTYLNNKFTNNSLQRFSLAVSNLLLGLCIAFLFFAYTKWYTVIAFSVLFVLIFYIEYVNHKLRFMYRFYRAYVVMLIPFYVCYGFLCNLPIIEYQFTATTGMKLANIPLENHFYMMAMLLSVVYLFELFKVGEAK